MTSGISSGELQISAENDIVMARRMVRDAATQLGFGVTDVTRLVTAASELARNVYKYAGQGVMKWSSMQADTRVGLQLQFVDQGPGIPDVAQAMEEGFTTGGGLGLGQAIVQPGVAVARNRRDVEHHLRRHDGADRQSEQLSRQAEPRKPAAAVRCALLARRLVLARHGCP